MELIQHTTLWVKGEVTQGRIGVGLAVLSIFLFFYFASFQQTFYKGMIFPIVLIQLVLLGYGGFQLVKRPSHIDKVAQGVQLQPDETLKKELLKSQNDDRVYSKLIPTWAALLGVSLILFFVLKSDFWRGMSFGFVIWFSVAFVFDNFLHQRLRVYLFSLEQLA